MMDEAYENHTNKQLQHKEEWIVCLVGDNKLYIKWMLSQIKEKVIAIYFEKDFHSYQKILNIFDVSETTLHNSSVHSVQEIKLEEHQRSIMQTLQTNRTYRIEYGIKLSKHKFFPLLRSEPIHIPLHTEMDERPKIVDIDLNIHLDLPIWENQVSTYSYYEEIKINKDA